MIGRTVSHYRIESQIGAGGMGVVYRATDLRLGRTVALNFLPPELTRATDAKERFIREAKSASSLDHPNICTIYDFEEADDHLFLAMACYEGETLKTRLTRGPLPQAGAIDIANQIARGLAKAHQRGIVHRDIKPANIMVTAERQIKILDFGLAKLAGDQTLTRAGMVVGSPPYMSPEQVRGDEIDQRTDIWSLGVVLYEMLAGKLPYRGDSSASTFHAILNRDFEPISGRPEINAVLRRALAKSRDERHPTAEEFLRELNAISIATESGATELKRTAPGSPAIAVLPFADMSPSRDQEYFCEGVAEEILNALTQITGLRVASRTSSFQFKGSEHDVRAIGERLNVSTILEGSVRKAGDRLRVTVQLINVSDGYHLWSKRYDSEVKDVFEIQDQVAESTVEALAPLLQSERPAVRKSQRTDLEAYEYYLRGRQLYELRRQSLEAAREMFERSVQHDPEYALAYSGIADCSSWLFLWYTGDAADLQTAEDASRRALELSPDLAEAHVSRGWALSLGKRYAEAAAEFEKAVALNPNLADAWYLYSRARFAEGRPEEAVPLGLKAGEVQLDDYQGMTIAALALQKLGKTGEEMALRRQILQRLERRLDIAPDDTRAMYLTALMLRRTGGDGSRADALIARAVEQDPQDCVVLYNAACYWAVAGDKERALQTLERAISGARAFYRDWVIHDPDLDPLRADPRFQTLIAKLR